MTNEHLEILKDMKRIRALEERAAELYGEMKIRGFLHLYVGQEAVAGGVIRLLEKDDSVVTAYREHGHALLRGISARKIMAEMYGKVQGCSRGRGGSMHLFDAKTNFYGGSAIVAGGIPIANGLALASKMKAEKSLTACFFGDGAVAEGEFHESINLAALWKLPVLFVCENNLYAMGTSLSRHQSQTNLSKKAESYKIASEQVDGMDVMAVNEATKRAIEYIKATGAPYFLEFLTYRFRAHSMFDPELYRSREEVKEWRKKDPIVTFTNSLKEQNVINEQQIRNMEQEVSDEIEDAVEFAEKGTLEDIKDLYRFTYYENQMSSE